MSTPCKIPRNLKPGDRLWYSETEYATVGPTRHCPTCYDDTSIRAQVEGVRDTMVYMLDTGSEYVNDTTPIIRIERITSKPKKAKVDRDAKWLMRLSGEGQTMDTDTMRRRIRAIARRLNGGKLP